jgi:hypothetical protein
MAKSTARTRRHMPILATLLTREQRAPQTVVRTSAALARHLRFGPLGDSRDVVALRTIQLEGPNNRAWPAASAHVDAVPRWRSEPPEARSGHPTADLRVLRLCAYGRQRSLI